MTNPRRLYVVRGAAPHGVIIHRCPTPELALDSMRRFTREAYLDVSVRDPDGALLSQSDLEARITGAVPSKPVVLTDRR